MDGDSRQSITGSYIEYLICDDLEETVRRTRWEKPVRFVKDLRNVYHSADRVTQLKTFCTHTAMEYMLGNGMEGIARSCLRRDGTLALVRWKKKKPTDMLGLDSNELARLRRMNPEQVNGYGLMALRFAREYSQRVKLEDAMMLCSQPVIRGLCMTEIKRALRQYGERWGVMRILRYANKSHGTLRMWLDYMSELHELGEDGDESRVFPRDLNEAHAQTSARIRYKADEEIHRKLAERAEALAEKMRFEACGLVLEPFRTAAEIIHEGKVQSICIGSYVKRWRLPGLIL